jgi:choline dehydrogenase
VLWKRRSLWTGLDIRTKVWRGRPQWACHLGDPGDLKAVITAIELFRDIADSDIFHPFLKPEITPGSLKGSALEQIVRNSVNTIWHQSCTAKMGRDAMSVVDSHLTVDAVRLAGISDDATQPRGEMLQR